MRIRRLLTIAGAGTVVAALLTPPVAAAERPGIGYAENKIEGVGIHVGGALDAVLIGTEAWSTTDPAESGHDEVSAYSEFVPGMVRAGDQTLRVPDPYIRHATEGGLHYDWGTLGDVVVGLPPSNLPVPSDQAAALQRVVDAASAVAEDVREVLFPPGSITDGVVYVGRQYAEIGTDEASTLAHSEAQEVDLISGLATIRDAGLGDHTTWAGPDTAGAHTREVKIGSASLLNIDALLRFLGVDADTLGGLTYAAMADALGVPRTEKVNALDPGEFESWQHAVAIVDQTVDAVSSAVTAGVTCDALDLSVQTNFGFALPKRLPLLGMEPPDCLGLLNAPDTLLAALTALQSDLADVVAGLVQETPLLGIEGLDSRITVAAGIDEQGVPNSSVSLGGSLGKITVGHNPVGGFTLDDAATAWNDVENTTADYVNRVLGVLGDPFLDLVRVRIVPTIVERTAVEGDYAVAEGKLTVFEVTVRRPDLSLEEIAHEIDGGLAHYQDLLLGRAADEPALTFVLGAMEARAAHTRPGVDVQCSASCLDHGLVNRTWDPQLGFGDPAGRLPRTGGSSGLLAVGALAAVGSAGAIRRIVRHGAAGPARPPR